MGLAPLNCTQISSNGSEDGSATQDESFHLDTLTYHGVFDAVVHIFLPLAAVTPAFFFICFVDSSGFALAFCVRRVVLVLGPELVLRGAFSVTVLSAD